VTSQRSADDVVATPFDADHHPLAGLVAAVVTAGTLTVAFGLLALGVEFFWVAFPLGFGGVLPVSMGVLAYRARTGDGQSTPSRHSHAEEDDALEQLRRRYARGELTDAEFERRVERLLETEPRAAPGAGETRRSALDRTQQ